MMDDSRILAWVSGGAASVVAAKLAITEFGIDRVDLVVCETGNEDEDNYRFERDAEEWLGKSITVLKSKKYEDVLDVWTKRRFISGPKGAPCTTYMKIEPRIIFQRPTDVHIFGYTADARDVDRFQSLKNNYFEIVARSPLIECGLLKTNTLQIIIDAGLRLPRSYAMGFPNANCLMTGCGKATSPDYWSFFRFHFPDRFLKTAKFSRSIGAKLVRIQNKRRFLDELPIDWPMLQPIAPMCDFLCGLSKGSMPR